MNDEELATCPHCGATQYWFEEMFEKDRSCEEPPLNCCHCGEEIADEESE